jgi:hypothetical protein
MRVIKNKLCVLNQQACGQMKIKRTTKKAKHDPGTSRSKVYEYYDVFKGIF